MNPNPDPAHEIKRALDREVERRFDADGFQAIEPPGSRRTGPLDRIPVPMQWLGIAAAVVAAVTGLRLLYVDRIGRPIADAPGAQAVLREPAPQPVAETLAPEPPPVQPRVERPRRQAPTQPEPPSAVPRSVESASESMPASDPAPAHPPSPLVAREAAPGTPGATTEPPRTVSPESEHGSAQPDPAPYVHGGAAGWAVGDASVGGVRRVRFASGRVDLVPTIREAPSVGATIVSLVPTSASSGTNPRADRERRDAARAEARPGRQPPVYVRLLAGTRVPVAATGPLALVGKFMLEETRRPGREIWGSEEHQAFLRSTFDLKSILALPGERALPAEAGLETHAGLVASLGGAVYQLVISAGPTKLDLQQFEVSLAGASDDSDYVHGSLLVERNRVVVLALPDPRRVRAGGRIATSGPVLFVVLTAGFEGPDRLVAADPDVEPPILIEGPDPLYPDQARAQQLAGNVVLRALVRTDGTVEEPQVLEAPEETGARLLVEAAVEAVRQRSYLPARRRGERVEAYVTITFEFRADGSVGARVPPGP